MKAPSAAIIGLCAVLPAVLAGPVLPIADTPANPIQTEVTTYGSDPSELPAPADGTLQRRAPKQMMLASCKTADLNDCWIWWIDQGLCSVFASWHTNTVSSATTDLSGTYTCTYYTKPGCDATKDAQGNWEDAWVLDGAAERIPARFNDQFKAVLCEWN